MLSGEWIVPRVCLFACFSSLQIGYERHWLHFLKEFIVPVNARLYPGYNSEVRINPTRYSLIFVLKFNKIVALSILLRGFCREVLWSVAAAFSCKPLAPVVQRLDNAIHRINHYPVDSVVCFVNTYPLDSDLSSG